MSSRWSASALSPASHPQHVRDDRVEQEVGVLGHGRRRALPEHVQPALAGVENRGGAVDRLRPVSASDRSRSSITAGASGPAASPSRHSPADRAGLRTPAAAASWSPPKPPSPRRAPNRTTAAFETPIAAPGRRPEANATSSQVREHVLGDPAVVRREVGVVPGDDACEIRHPGECSSSRPARRPRTRVRARTRARPRYAAAARTAAPAGAAPSLPPVSACCGSALLAAATLCGLGAGRVVALPARVGRAPARAGGAGAGRRLRRAAGALPGPLTVRSRHGARLLRHPAHRFRSTSATCSGRSATGSPTRTSTSACSASSTCTR